MAHDLAMEEKKHSCHFLKTLDPKCKERQKDGVKNNGRKGSNYTQREKKTEWKLDRYSS